MEIRNTVDIIADIKVLVNKKGFIYTLCLIIIEDFHFNVEKMHEIDIRARLNKNEVSLLIGFLIQRNISTVYFLYEVQQISYAAFVFPLHAFHLSISSF